MEIAVCTSQWSKDPSTKVGAVIVSPDKQILSTGYNGFPANIEDKPEWYDDREMKYSLIIHAEMNAILNAAKNGINIKDAWLFVTSLPVCANCAKHVCQAGIGAVVRQDNIIDPRWADSSKAADTIFGLAKIPIYKI